MLYSDRPMTSVYLYSGCFDVEFILDCLSLIVQYETKNLVEMRICSIKQFDSHNLITLVFPSCKACDAICGVSWSMQLLSESI